MSENASHLLEEIKTELKRLKAELAGYQEKVRKAILDEPANG